MELRPVTPDELRAFLDVDSATFGGHVRDSFVDAIRGAFEFDRSLAVFDDGKLVATAGAFSFDVTLPGAGTLPAGGVSWVGTLPTHRRRGYLRAMMERQLTDMAEREEPLAILYASESSIYGRFGYGPATTRLDLEIDPRWRAMAVQMDVPGRLCMLDRPAAELLIPAVHDLARRRQPGDISRPERMWKVWFSDPEDWRDGASARFYVIYEAPDGDVQGYVAYRIKEHWERGIPSFTMILSDLRALTSGAQFALWSYCLNVDLVALVKILNRPPDEPLRWMLADQRRLRVDALGDSLWVRLLDVPVALAARQYAAEGSLTFLVSDPFRPQQTGSYRLEGGPHGADCRRTEEEPDLALNVADLGATYLGGVTFSTLARSGRISELKPGALRRADLMFSSEPAPWCTTMF